MTDSLISVVMATYNGEAYLREQLDSILNQTYQNFELIVVDDGSKDETLTILNEYSRIDERVIVFPAEENLGVVKNFERGLKLTKGDFIALSDQDDVFRKDKLEVLLNTICNNPNCDMVVSDLTLIDHNGKEFAQSFWNYQRLKPVAGKPFRRLIYSNFVTGCALMFNRRLLLAALPFPSDCKVHDWWLAVVAASSKCGGICLIDEQLVYYRQHDKNVIGAKKAIQLSDLNWTSIKNILSDKNIIEKRRCYFICQADRLLAYLESNIWSFSEKMIIEKSRELFLNCANESQESLIERVSNLFPRLHYGFSVGGFRSCMGIVLRTLLPFL
jgi:glycosyltransferase involved in cell wall biosynthesis